MSVQCLFTDNRQLNKSENKNMETRMLRSQDSLKGRVNAVARSTQKK